MSDPHAKIGEKAGPYFELVSQREIDLFKSVVGSTSVFPPTYWTRFRKGEFELFKSLALPLSRVLHAGQAYEIHSEITPGTEVEYQTVFQKYDLKKSSAGNLHFFEFLTQVREKGSKPLADSKTTIIVRGELDV